MPDVKKSFVLKGVRKMEIDSYFAKEFSKAGYSKCDIQKTPLGTRITIYAERPGMIIGRHGAAIRELTQTLEKKFSLEALQIDVMPMPTAPELSASVMASRIASALEKGIHFRRAAFIATRQIMEAGAKGAEIIISGKLTTERARYEKYRMGRLLKSGEPKETLIDKAVTHAYLKPGIFGVEVRIALPQATPDEEIVGKLEAAKLKEAKPKEKVEEVEG